MTDLISRADVIRLLVDKYKFTTNEATEILSELPSAVCDDCIWHVCNYNKVDWDAPSAEAKGDLISRQDAVNTIKRYKHRLQGKGQTYGFLLEEFEHRIPSAEAVQGEDAVEVVRCKDCRHRYMDGEVTHYYWCRLHDRPVDDADYCAWGEESEVEE